MKRTMTQKELQRLVEQKVDELSLKRIGKGVLNTAIGAGLLVGGVRGCGDAIDQQWAYEQGLNQQAASNMVGSEPHYQKWCKDNNMNPDDNSSRISYNDYFAYSVQENKKRKLIEKKISNIVKKVLNEGHFEEPNPWIQQYAKDGDKKPSKVSFEAKLEKCVNSESPYDTYRNICWLLGVHENHIALQYSRLMAERSQYSGLDYYNWFNQKKRLEQELKGENWRIQKMKDKETIVRPRPTGWR